MTAVLGLALLAQPGGATSADAAAPTPGRSGHGPQLAPNGLTPQGTDAMLLGPSAAREDRLALRSAEVAEQGPSAPRGLVAEWYPPSGGFHLQWEAPESDGGTPVTGYLAVADDHDLGTLPASARGAWIRVSGPGHHTIGVAAYNDEVVGQVATIDVVAPEPPANDAFARRTVLSGRAGMVEGDNSAASAEAGDPKPPGVDRGAGGASLWYAWTAAGTGPVTFTTDSDQDYRDTTLAAYTGTSLTSLTEIARNDDIDVDADEFLSQIRFRAVAGRTYLIAVDGNRGYLSGVGQFTLNWSGTAAPTRAASRTALSAPRTAAAGSRPVVRISAMRASSPARGTVRLRVGKRVVTLTLRNGVASYQLAKVKAGKLKLSATYLGNATTVASKATATITVRKR